MVEDDRSVLGSFVVALLVFDGGVVESEEEFHEVFVVGFSVVESNVENLNVRSVSLLHVFVFRIRNGVLMRTHETNTVTQDRAWKLIFKVLAKELLRSPIAPSSKRCLLFSFCSIQEYFSRIQLLRCKRINLVFFHL